MKPNAPPFSVMWYNAKWVDAFYRVLWNGDLNSGDSISRPTEQAAFRNLALQSEYAMRLRALVHIKVVGSNLDDG